jgi:hypothetical protein
VIEEVRAEDPEDLSVPSPDREIVCVVVVQGEGGEVTDLKSPN